MKKIIFFFVIITACVMQANAAHIDSLMFFNATRFQVIGKAFWETESPYDRLPVYLKDSIRKELWDLGKNTAGVAVRFRTNSTAIGAKWTVLNNFSMRHMTNVGIKGVDLYCYDEGSWTPVKAGQPSGKENKSLIIDHMDGAMREYMLYLPLYDGIENLEIGIDPGAEIAKPALQTPCTQKPIVIYGTSITQGGCASRPGMAFPSILSRFTGREVINLGFSGNGRLDLEIARAMADQTDPCVFVLDCAANCTPEIIRERCIPFIGILRGKHPDTPIVLVDNIRFPYARFDRETAENLDRKTKEYGKVMRYFKEEMRDGNIYFMEGTGLIHEEGTVDGTHLTDLGNMGIAQAFYEYLRRFNVRSTNYND